MAVSKRLRYEILRRDNHTCRYCGASAPHVPLTVDHVTPKTLGGTDEPANLVAACADCNSGKSATPPDAPLVADVSSDAVRWAAAVKRAEQLQLVERAEEEVYMQAFLNDWNGYCSAGGTPWVAITADGYSTIQKFRRAGLSVNDLAYAAAEAFGATHIPMGRVWRYFCGICWRVVEQRHQIARELLQADEVAPDGS